MDGNQSKVALSARGLCKSFRLGDGYVEVIKDLSFELADGAFEAVMGPSGSGKSTLLHLLAGLLAADRGEITIGGESVTAMNDRQLTLFRRRRIGLIFQDFNLIPTLTAEENVALPLLLDKNEREHRARVDELITALGLEKRRRHLPAKLSGGERQRVAIARALAGNPAVVLADEPTGNLDSPAARDFCDLLRQLNRDKGYTILMVSHDPVVAAAARRVRLLRDGRFMDAFDTGDSAEQVARHYLAAMGR